MTPELIAAFTGVLVALAALVTAFTTMWRELKKNTATTNATHELVNNKADEQLLRIGQLETSMERSGVSVPVDPAIAAAARRVDDKDEPWEIHRPD